MTLPDVTLLSDEALDRLIDQTDGALSLRDLHAALLDEQDEREYEASRCAEDDACQRGDDDATESGEV
jgi:hypothetical protein